MKLSINADTYLDTILVLRDELNYVCEKVNEKYREVKEPATIGIAIRCLPDELRRRTFTRYHKKDKYLTIDMTVSLETYKKLYRIEQRHQLGHAIFANLTEALNKYEFKSFDQKFFLKDFRQWSNEIQWLMDEVDYSTLD